MTPAAAAGEPPPAFRKGSPAEGDAMLAAIDALCAGIGPRLAAGLTLSRDNPGRTPQQWSVRDGDGRAILSVGLVDRTFFWTWDEGVSNHYAKSPELMVRVIAGELRRFGYLT